MVKLNFSFKFPNRIDGILALILGLATVGLYSTQMMFDWYGANLFDKTFYSLLVLFMAGLSAGLMYSSNFCKEPDFVKAITISLVVVIGVILLIMSMNGGLMMMDAQYADFVNEGRGGYFYGVHLLSNQITESDISQLGLFADGISQLVRALFLIVPGLIGTWGGLGVLMASDMTEATIGIMAILAAMVVFFIVWIFKAIDVSLMSLIPVFGEGAIRGIVDMIPKQSVIPVVACC